MGAQFGVYGALAMPDRVRRLVILGAPGAGFVGVRPIPVMKVLAVPGLGRVLLSLPTTDKQFRGSIDMALGPGVADTFPRALYDAARLVGSRRDNAAGTASYFHAMLQRGRVRPGVAVPPEELTRLAQPVLLVWGDRDVFLTPEAAKESIGALPDARLLALDAGHGPWLEHPDEVGRAVSAHLGD